MTRHEDVGAGYARQDPGRAARLLVDTLAVEGFGVQVREWDELWHLTITGVREARSCLIVGDTGYLRWEYQPGSGAGTSPAATAELILRLLGAAALPGSPPADDTYPSFLLKGAAGRLLEDQGMKAELLSYEDLEFFDVSAEIQVTNPAWPGRGTVRLSDNADLEWECHTKEAFGGDAGPVAGLIAPVLRQGLGIRAPRRHGPRP
jgi:hypothetical protein